MDILSLNRRIFTDRSTIGDLFYRGVPFSQTLEDTSRRIKVYGKTAIPAGRYMISLAPSPKRGYVVPWLHDVPKFSNVQIHRGNRPEDTEGCILVGKYSESVPDFISSSKSTFENLMERLTRETEPIYINITGGVRS